MGSKQTEVLVYDQHGFSKLIGRMRATLREKGQFRVQIRTSRKRSLEQNSCYYEWIDQIYIEQGEDTKEEIRRFCKLEFFSPILMRDNDEFRETMSPILSKLSHPERMRVMDLIQVSSICTTAQMSEGMERMQMHYAALTVGSVELIFGKDS